MNCRLSSTDAVANCLDIGSNSPGPSYGTVTVVIIFSASIKTLNSSNLIPTKR